MGFNEWFTIINTIIGIIGVIVGIIGGKSLHTAMKIKNSIKYVKGSTVQQAQTITVNNGIDTYAVIKLSRETTKEELKGIIDRFNQAENELTSVKEKVNNLPPVPKIHMEKTAPTRPLEDNEIWGVYK